LESREVAITAWEDGLAVLERALGWVCKEHDYSHVQAKAAQQDYLARMCAFISWSKQLISLSRMLEEHHILLCLQKMDLEVRKAMLVEEQEQEQERDLYPHNGWDLSAELEGIHARVDRIEVECAAEVGQLSWLVMEISNALADLGMLPIQVIPQLPKSA
jgi:hypothetical protein